jgi:hypothetical protein
VSYDELDTVAGSDAIADKLNVTVPHSARVWNYWLGGKDTFAADREVDVVPGRRRYLATAAAIHWPITTAND